MIRVSRKNECLSYFNFVIPGTGFKPNAMTNNLHKADLIAKLSLAVLTLLFYFAGAIAGPFATVLMILSIVVLLIYAIKALISNWDEPGS